MRQKHWLKKIFNAVFSKKEKYIILGSGIGTTYRSTQEYLNKNKTTS